jgi:hypothetical protein
LTVAVEIDGALSSSGVSPSQQAGAQVAVGILSKTMLWADSALDCPTCPVILGSATDITFENGLLSGTFQFVYGTPFHITSQFVVSGIHGGDAAFANTLTFFLGLPQGASITSENNAVYRTLDSAAVPSPSAFWMVSTAFALLAFVKMRRR